MITIYLRCLGLRRRHSRSHGTRRQGHPARAHRARGRASAASASASASARRASGSSRAMPEEAAPVGMDAEAKAEAEGCWGVGGSAGGAGMSACSNHSLSQLKPLDEPPKQPVAAAEVKDKIVVRSQIYPTSAFHKGLGAEPQPGVAVWKVRPILAIAEANAN